MIISFIFVNLMFDSGEILLGETKCWSLLGGKRVKFSNNLQLQVNSNLVIGWHCYQNLSCMREPQISTLPVIQLRVNTTFPPTPCWQLCQVFRKFARTHLYLVVKRYTVGDKCLIKQQNTRSLQGQRYIQLICFWLVLLSTFILSLPNPF